MTLCTTPVTQCWLAQKQDGVLLAQKPSRSNLGLSPVVKGKMVGAGPENVFLCHALLREVDLSLSETRVRVDIAQIFLLGFSRPGICC